MAFHDFNILYTKHNLQGLKNVYVGSFSEVEKPKIPLELKRKYNWILDKNEFNPSLKTAYTVVYKSINWSIFLKLQFLY